MIRSFFFASCMVFLCHLMCTAFKNNESDVEKDLEIVFQNVFLKEIYFFQVHR